MGGDVELIRNLNVQLSGENGDVSKILASSVVGSSVGELYVPLRECE